ncbi:winged helix-turn-helix domain-containing protein [Arthrobacter sp. PsM3]|uniref:winged helix-turn-helix domain-containing protein n=1 Tax=Arthrobacter sp. PsM3 TaxID=3030531 RepID=UPI00263AC060|nr:winged helix-turn-helix domain-containing protein [Arthrobacter sp. PsM3]MDN4645309.1 winged helix-turn-helix domain-containing protein [Arthrobacter sp. PsM3]
MATEAHSPRGIYPGPTFGPRLRAHGLAVWVTPGGQETGDAELARAARLLLERALRLVPEAEVHSWPTPEAAPPAGSASLVSVDLAAGEVRLDGQRVPLTGVEFRLLRYLVENCSRIVGREELRLFLESFDSPAAASRSIDVYVGRVRRKLRGGRHAITTVRGGGYQFVPGLHTKVRGPAEYSI